MEHLKKHWGKYTLLLLAVLILVYFYFEKPEVKILDYGDEEKKEPLVFKTSTFKTIKVDRNAIGTKDKPNEYKCRGYRVIVYKFDGWVHIDVLESNTSNIVSSASFNVAMKGKAEK